MRCFKKIVVLMLVLCCVLSGCSNKPEARNKPMILCETFVEYDWTRNILGSHVDEFDLELLLDTKVDMHNFQPTAEDLMLIKDCELFIYVGGESSDKWIDKVKQNIGTDAIMLDLSEAIKDRLLGDDDGGFDEHIWLSINNAMLLCQAIETNIIELDPMNSDDYCNNLINYSNQLDELNQELLALLDTTGKQVLVVADRFPFAYLCADYDIAYYAAFEGCSAETEVSFETIQELADIINQHNLNKIVVVDKENSALATSVIKASNRDGMSVYEMSSMQSVGLEGIDTGVTYCFLMKKNIQVLSEVFKDNAD